MVSVKVKLRPSQHRDREGALYYQIICKRVVRQLASGYLIAPCEWDQKNGRVVTDGSTLRFAYLSAVSEKVAKDLARIRSVIGLMEAGGRQVTADEIIEAVVRRRSEGSLTAFMGKQISRLKVRGRQRTAETYASTLGSFLRFRAGEDILLDEIDAEVVADYQAWLLGRGIGMNTVSFYMRILRAVYNRAVVHGLAVQSHPFAGTYTGVGKTVKRAVGLETLRKLKEADLSQIPPLEYARDMFMLSFYTRGMSFVDMAYLKKKDLRDGFLSYSRRKTGQQLTLRWEPCMQEIVSKYSRDGSPYLLDIIARTGGSERQQYRNAILKVNKNLKKTAALLGIDSRLTTYVARHSWASIAKSKNIPLGVISTGMGHESEKTTRIYLDSLDASQIDNANSSIIEDL